METLNLLIEGMSCDHCVRAVKNRLVATAGVHVEDVQIGSARLRYDPSKISIDAIEEAVSDEGYTSFVQE